MTATARAERLSTNTHKEGRALAEAIRDPEIPVRPEVPDVELDYDQAFGLAIERDCTVVVIPARGVFGSRSKHESPLLRGPTVLGVIVSCLQEVWTIESEPTGGDRFGFVICTERRKPLMVGEGTVPDDETAFDVSLKTVYERVSSSPRNDSVSGTARCNTNGVCEGSITYTYNF